MAREQQVLNHLPACHVTQGSDSYWKALTCDEWSLNVAKVSMKTLLCLSGFLCVIPAALELNCVDQAGTHGSIYLTLLCTHSKGQLVLERRWPRSECVVLLRTLGHHDRATQLVSKQEVLDYRGLQASSFETEFRGIKELKVLR